MTQNVRDSRQKMANIQMFDKNSCNRKKIKQETKEQLVSNCKNQNTIDNLFLPYLLQGWIPPP